MSVSVAGNPIRFPDAQSRPAMTKRAWWLVVLNILVPGSAQVLAGNRRLGRFALAMTLTLWAAIAVAAALWFFAREALLTVVTNIWGLLAIEVFLVFYAILWVILAVDTLRLARLVRVAPVARPLLAIVALAMVTVLSGGAGYAAHVADVARSAIASIFDGQVFTEPVDGRYNILLLGGDAGPDRDGLRPDSISVVSIDAETGDTAIIGVPRNQEFVRFSEGSPLWGPFPKGYDCGDQCLISYLYTYASEHPELYPNAEANGTNPGIEAMRDAVGGTVGLTLQNFVLIDMQGFADLIDALGGVDIDVPERTAIGAVTGSKPLYWVEVGPQHMDGEGALWYGRSRFNSSDFSRMARQRQVQEAMLRQFEPANVVTKFQAIAEAGAQVVDTDISSGMVARFADLAGKSRQLPLTRLELAPPEFNPGNPDYERIKQAVQATFVRSEKL